MAALRGYKKTRTSMFIIVGSYVVFRQVYMLIISMVLPNKILPILLAFPFGWIIAATSHVIVWLTSPIMKANRILKKHPEANALSVEQLLEWKKNGFPQLEEVA